jgi:hypothetical protein
MCTGIALALSELPAGCAADPRLAGRVYNREGREEIQFHWWQTPTLLPVRWEGQLHLLPWGCKSKRGPLPVGGWLPRDWVEDGSFAAAGAEPAVVPANLGHHKGTWFLIAEGIRGLVLRDRDGRPVVYLLTEPATNYYRNMTEQEPMMPVLVGQVI